MASAFFAEPSRRGQCGGLHPISTSRDRIGIALRLFSILDSGLLAACLSPSSFRAPPVDVDILVAALDQSVGTATEVRCDEATAAVAEYLEAREPTRLDVLVLGSGQAPGYRPETLVPWTTLADDGVILRSPEAVAKRRRDVFRSLRDGCQQKLTVHDESPIYALAVAAGDAVQARCGDLVGLDAVCRGREIFLASDLRETVEKAIVKALTSPTKANIAALAPLRLPFGKDVRLVVCDVANSTDKALASEQAVNVVWRALLGENAPAAFSPPCPRSWDDHLSTTSP